MQGLSQQQIDFYNDNGYLVLEKHLPDDVIAEARSEIERLSKHAETISQSDDLLDVEDSHTREQPRIRRIKRPDLQSAFFDQLMRSDYLLGPATELIGPNIRMQTTKLNMKKASFGAPVQWHQDYAFYPHTNDDLLAIGVVFDDVQLENGPLQVIPGSHKGPIFNHHTDGVFTGSIDLEDSGIDLAKAVPLMGPAGTITIHHCRILHGSALNVSDRDRQILFYEMMAADAFPIMGSMTEFNSIEEYNDLMLCGNPTLEPRLKEIPSRIPQPQPAKAGSIYEVQSTAKGTAFKTFEETIN